MMQTRKQAAAAIFPVPSERKVRRCILKEVRIPTARQPASTLPVIKETTEQEHAPVSSLQHSSTHKPFTTKASPLMAVVKEVFDTALHPPPSPTPSPLLSPQDREVVQALQYRIEDYIVNSHDPAWQPWPFTPAYALNTLGQVLEELHGIATHAGLCEYGDWELEFEALAHAMLWGRKLLERLCKGGVGREEQYREGVTEIHLAVYGFVEQVVEAQGRGLVISYRQGGGG